MVSSKEGEHLCEGGVWANFVGEAIRVHKHQRSKLIHCNKPSNLQPVAELIVFSLRDRMLLSPDLYADNLITSIWLLSYFWPLKSRQILRREQEERMASVGTFQRRSRLSDRLCVCWSARERVCVINLVTAPPEKQTKDWWTLLVVVVVAFISDSIQKDNAVSVWACTCDILSMAGVNKRHCNWVFSLLTTTFTWDVDRTRSLALN